MRSVDRPHPILGPMVLVPLLALAAGCGGDDDPGDSADDNADSADLVDAQDEPGIDADPGAPDAPGGNPLDSTLTATCATLQGRAIVNENGNLGVSFTEDDSPFTFIGSVQWELPSGFTGAVPNPENWDGDEARKLVGVTSPGFELFGSHCWTGNPPPAPALTRPTSSTRAAIC